MAFPKKNNKPRNIGGISVNKGKDIILLALKDLQFSLEGRVRGAKLDELTTGYEPEKEYKDELKHQEELMKDIKIIVDAIESGKHVSINDKGECQLQDYEDCIEYLEKEEEQSEEELPIGAKWEGLSDDNMEKFRRDICIKEKYASYSWKDLNSEIQEDFKKWIKVEEDLSQELEQESSVTYNLKYPIEVHGIAWVKKPSDMNDALMLMREVDEDYYKDIKISNLIFVDNKEYDEILDNLISDRNIFENLTSGVGLLENPIAVYQTGKESIIIATEGFNYARYVGIVMPTDAQDNLDINILDKVKELSE